jgi:cell division septation protein DedD
MAPSYYVIELTARWLAALLGLLAGVMILAFVFGYGAAWSVLEHEQRASEPVAHGGPVAGTPTPTPVEVRVAPADPTATFAPPVRATATPEPIPTSAPAPPTAIPAPPTPRPTATPAEAGYWVQLLASSNREAVDEAAAKLADLGFTSSRQRIVRIDEGGNELLKLRVGPFPDRASAERVTRRMQDSGFPDAWVVAP